MLKKILIIIVSVLVLLGAGLCGFGYYISTAAGQLWVKNVLLKELADILQTDLKVDRVTLDLKEGDLNLYGFEMYDRKGVAMLTVDTLEAEVTLTEILTNHIVINGVKLSGARACLYKERRDTAANYQFFFDTFKHDKKKKKKGNAIDLDLDYIECKHLGMTWDVRSERLRGGDTLDVNHLKVEDMGVTLTGKLLAEKTYDIRVSNLHAKECKSNIHFNLAKITYRTVRKKNVNVELTGMKANYQDKKVAFRRILIKQNTGHFSFDHDMKLHIDSIEYSCDNGKPRKNTGRPNRGAFDKGHLDAVMNCTMTLHGIKDNVLKASINHLWALDRGSGLLIKDLRTFATVTDKTIELVNLHVQMAKTHVVMRHVQMDYNFVPGNKRKGIKSKFNMNIKPSLLTADVALQDIAKPFAPPLSNFTTPLKLSVVVAGTLDRITFNKIKVTTPDGRLRISAEGDLCDVAIKHKYSLHFPKINMDARSGIKDQIINHFSKKIKLKMLRQMKAIGDIHFSGSLGVKRKLETIRGTLYTKHGNVDVDFDIDGKTRYLTGTMNAKGIDLGAIMNIPKLGPISLTAQYKFDIASKRIAKEIGRFHGRLPQGWLNADVREARFGIVNFANLKAQIESNGRTAEGVIYIPKGLLDIVVGFAYTQTDEVQKLKVKPSLTKHRDKPVTLSSYRQKQAEKQAKKDRKKAEKAARKAEKAARKAAKEAARAAKELKIE